jgi:hypothetical protein
MSGTHGFHEIFMRVMHEAGRYHSAMTHLRSSANSRTLTVVLSEADWQALRAVEPDAVGWLHARIRERLGAAAAQESGTPRTYQTATNAASTWGEDLY